MSLKRIPTGINGLDPIVDGGFPKGSLILLAGNPGTGKTIFSAQFLYHGVTEHGENGVYVSFAESRETFFSNMLDFGFEFEKLEEKGKFRFLDMVTMREEGVSSLLEMILSEVRSIKAGRLVIDSFSAMAQAFKEKIEARIILHTVLGKIVRQAGCTTLIVCEVPIGEEHIGVSIEEFVADGVFILKKSELEGRLAREIGIVKLRGTKLSQLLYFFTLEKGFQVFLPFRPRTIERVKKFQPVPDSEHHFSTGSKDLDRILDGGYPKGGIVFIEIGATVSVQQYHLILVPTLINFIRKGRSCLAYPSLGLSVNQISYISKKLYGLTDEEFNSLVRIFMPALPGTDLPEPYTIAIEGNLQADIAKMLKIEAELYNRTKRQPFVADVSLDTLEVVYGKPVIREINQCIARTKGRGNLMILHARPGVDPYLRQKAADISDIHLKIMREHGTLLFYGVKPRTGLYVVEMDMSKGYPLPKLIPIV